MLPKGFKHSEQTIQKMRDWNLNRPPASEETRRKQSESARRKALPSDETKRRMSEAHQRRRLRERAERFSEQTGIDSSEYLSKLETGDEWCQKCQTFKPSDRFGKRSTCLDCIYEKNEAWYKRNRDAIREKMRERYAANTNGARDKNKEWSLRGYGASIKWYEETLEEQGGGCAICGKTTFEGDHKHFAVDHDHRCCTGKKRACDRCRRGLLCPRCNLAIERIETIPGWIESATSYLQRYALDGQSSHPNSIPAADEPIRHESSRGTTL